MLLLEVTLKEHAKGNSAKSDSDSKTKTLVQHLLGGVFNNSANYTAYDRASTSAYNSFSK